MYWAGNRASDSNTPVLLLHGPLQSDPPDVFTCSLPSSSSSSSSSGLNANLKLKAPALELGVHN